MKPVIVTTGDDPLTAPVMAYLERIGVPRGLVRRVELVSPVGDVQLVTVTMMVDRAALEAAPE